MSTTQRTAVITGATSEKGIGVTTARRFAREGWGVVILDLDAEKSSQVARSIAAATTGQIEVWVTQPEPRDVELFLALNRRLMPAWWPNAIVETLA